MSLYTWMSWIWMKALPRSLAYRKLNVSDLPQIILTAIVCIKGNEPSKFEFHMTLWCSYHSLRSSEWSPKKDFFYTFETWFESQISMLLDQSLLQYSSLRQSKYIKLKFRTAIVVNVFLCEVFLYIITYFIHVIALYVFKITYRLK